MQIKIYSKEKGLHNPFNPEVEGGPYILANFLILCVSRVCSKYGVTEHQLFSKSRKGDLPNIRGAMMNFLYKNRKFQGAWRLTSTQIGEIFLRDHSTVMHFCRPESDKKCGEMSYMKMKEDVWRICDNALVGNKFNLVNFESMLFSYRELLDFAFFVGATEEKLQDFIKLRA